MILWPHSEASNYSCNCYFHIFELQRKLLEHFLSLINRFPDLTKFTDTGLTMTHGMTMTFSGFDQTFAIKSVVEISTSSKGYSS
mmetsp:Transcript_29270/g.95729  ORF Transcript_29270/g.95729 Transcript_29270/m.95729 type:complete len:84 (+) Transcript_29270:644-895(+)